MESVIVDGVRYESKPEGEAPCAGCDALGDEILCSNLPECSLSEIIWIKAEHQPTDDFTHGKIVHEEDEDTYDGFYGGSEDYLEKAQYDIVNKPKHYVLFEKEGIEVRDVIEKLVDKFTYGSANYNSLPIKNNTLFSSDYVQMMQYLMRFMDKNGKQDLEKAKWYLEKLIESYKE